MGMIEIVLAIGMIITMVKIADADGQSGIFWGTVALLFTVLCFMFFLFAFVRILLAAILTFAAMTVYKMVRK
jgi:hypothetical protein